VLLFTGFSFSFWLTDFQAEYLGTDIFIIFYANGLVCIISGQFNLFLYPKLGLRNLVFWTQGFSIVAATMILLIQMKVFHFDSPEEEVLFVSISIPCFLFMLSLAVQVGFTAIFQAAFEDDRILPFNKRATSINIIILVSKSVTIGAPFANEEEEPIPIVIILGL